MNKYEMTTDIHDRKTQHWKMIVKTGPQRCRDLLRNVSFIKKKLIRPPNYAHLPLPALCIGATRHKLCYVDPRLIAKPLDSLDEFLQQKQQPTVDVENKQAYILFHSFTVLWEDEYFLTSNLLCLFTSVKSCSFTCLNFEKKLELVF